MRVVNEVEPGVIELNFMWLPTFISQNVPLMKELKRDLEKTFLREQVTEETLNSMHASVIMWLEQRFPFDGVGKYLHAIEEVKDA
ncbi:hypothetical protein UFOVP276_163 [uncultured Caudovirales phage]|uniref:Uncharacterized protein n=1 Tax=uncultured Caudovirales phage TaxID=2100421 RepID=A0A6J5LQC7_9CAUD|nr:hypothetical protein UFOVP127_57 [uncultured Caudovirales phage]CAB4135207.1 hypothetical protein UFOVP276_163 [uncultured Caudovirales phage]